MEKTRILELIKDKPRTFKWFIKKEDLVFYQSIDNQPYSFSEALFRYVYNPTPKCGYCGNEPPFLDFRRGFREFCSKRCQSKGVVERIKETNIEKYGVENPFQSEQIKEKIKKTNIEKYGVVNPSQSGAIQQKIKDNCMKKHGVHHPNAVQEKRDSWVKKELERTYNRLKERVEYKLKPLFDLADYSGIEHLYDWECVECNTVFQDHLDNGRVPRCPTCYPYIITSKNEDEIEEFIKSLGVDVIRNTRDVISPKELDIYLPDFNLAIEHCGLYWHNNKRKDKTYHKEKHDACLEKGIQLITVFEDEWNYNADKCKRIIKHKLGYTNRIYARKTTVERIGNSECRDFLNEYHIQGYVNSSINYGLISDGDIVAVMTIGKTRYNKKYEYEILRFATNGCSVVGGLSKLLKAFMREYKPSSIMTYVDRRWGNGDGYEAVGFERIQDKPTVGFYYTNKSSTKRYHRQKFTKKKLVEQGFDENMTADEIMSLQGYSKIYDCGNEVLVIKNIDL